MAGETSGPGPSEQEIRMVALERKFDELLSFVQLIAKRNTDDENQRKEDDKDTSEAEPEGHSNTNATPPRPPTPPKARRGKTPNWTARLIALEEKIRLIQGLNSFGNTDFSSMSWFPNMTVPPKFKAPEFEKYNGRGDPMIHLQMYCRKMAPYADNEPLLIQTFQDTLTGNAAEWYSQLKKISHWKELADTFLAQYGFNSQIAPDRFDLQRMEKKSNETFREYAQRWREKAARARPPLDEREMIKIFVDTLKNPYFDRMMGLQMQFFVDLIPVGDKDRRCLEEQRRIVDMTALMALAEQAAKKAPTKRKEGDVQMIGRNNGRPRQVLPTFTMQPIQPRPIQAPAPTQVPAPAPAPQMPARPVGNQPNDNRWLRKEPRQFTPLPMPMTELYPILIEKRPNLTYLGHTVENCGQLRHRVQDLIDHGVLKFEGLPNITTNPLPKHPEGGVNMVEIEEGNEESIAWRRLFYTLEKQKHITPLDAPPGPSTGDSLGREEIPSKGSRQPDDPSDFDWYAEINLDDIVEDEMDLDNLQDEEADWGYFMEDDTDEWRDVDFTEFFQFPCLIVPPGFVTPEFEIFYEDGDPEVHLQKYGEKMALHLENELLMISVFPESLSKQAAAWFYQLRNLTGWDDLVRVFLERYRFNPHSILEYLGLKKDEEPYIIPDPGVSKVIVEIKEESDMSSLPALAEGEEEEKDKPPPPAKEPDSITSAGEGEEPIKTPPSIIITTTAEEEYAGPMVEGLSIHTITEEEDSTTTPPARHCQQGEEVKTWTCVPLLQRVSSSNEVKSPREVKIGTRCAAEQKEALIALLREFHEIFAWSYQDMPGLDTDIVVPQDSFEARVQARKASTAPNEARTNIVPVPKKDGKQRTSYSPLWTDSQGTIRSRWPKEDKSKTAFVTHWGTFVYDVMPFGLKNAGATYQRAMVTLFHDMIHHEIEVYVDDMIAKSRTAQDHLTDLRKLFQRLKKYQLRLNPNKCAFGVTSGKLLGFIVSGRGIEIDPAKVQAIRSMPAPRTEKEIRSFLGRINYIARFIAQLTATCEPLFKLLRKDVKIKWTEDCQKAFDKIKEYLLNPPILVPPTPGRPLILYLTVQEASMGCMLGQQDETGKKEQAIYYLSKKFTEPGDPLLAIKGQAIADYLADYPSEQLELMDSEFPDEDVLVSPKGQQTPIAVKLGFDCTNNMTEYEACIVGLQAALEFGAYELEVFGDSLLIVSQTNGEWQARDPKLIPYQRYISRLVPKFKYLAEGDDVRPLRIETRDIPAYCVCVEECMNVEAEIDDKPWYYDIKRFIQDREYPPRATENEKKYIRRMAFQFFLSGEILYKRTHDATLLRCVDAEEANRHVQTCHKCQMYQNSKNAPPQYLHTMASPWPFSAWGMDVIGAITPKASNGHEFILVAIDYFTKWVEACSFKNVTQVAVTRFVKNNIICRYGMPEMLITDNASNLNNRMMDQLCQQFKIQHHNSAPYRPKMNGAVEAANKNVKKILSKMTETYKDWHEHLPYALCAYRTSVRTSVGATPYSLLEEAEWAQARYEQLNFIDEKRLAALCHGQLLPEDGSKELTTRRLDLALSNPEISF
uniref:Integrase catalytic domain-containing protein n=1 Tax=Fagus sylvatica TaxID=28930 RepID=A0A2N9IAM5_FAGSY